MALTDKTLGLDKLLDLDKLLNLDKLLPLRPLFRTRFPSVPRPLRRPTAEQTDSGDVSSVYTTVVVEDEECGRGSVRGEGASSESSMIVSAGPSTSLSPSLSSQ
mmetsp:Transcript_27516/g.56407  ORF Transcript_27516/g.56407 Transcript_27516/m.56407 type:complete len:104 (-) Transcript_27516:1063-1374(-)